MAVDRKACNCLLLKVNQIGSVTESIAAHKMAKSNGWGTMVSHRSGETEDAFIADLVVGLSTGQVNNNFCFFYSCKRGQLLSAHVGISFTRLAYYYLKSRFELRDGSLRIESVMWIIEALFQWHDYYFSFYRSKRELLAVLSVLPNTIKSSALKRNWVRPLNSPARTSATLCKDRVTWWSRQEIRKIKKTLVVFGGSIPTFYDVFFSFLISPIRVLLLLLLWAHTTSPFIVFFRRCFRCLFFELLLSINYTL